jgi:hypothetical protein
LELLVYILFYILTCKMKDPSSINCYSLALVPRFLIEFRLDQIPPPLQFRTQTHTQKKWKKGIQLLMMFSSYFLHEK